MIDAAEDARGGVLEAAGAATIKYRDRDIVATAHRLDHALVTLDAKLATAKKEGNDADINSVLKEISAREKMLFGVYQQVAVHFADLHDTPGRMKAKGVIRDVLSWPRSRAYLAKRLKRRLAEDDLRKQLTGVGVDHAAATESVKKIVGDSAYDDDEAFLAKLAEDGPSIEAQVGALKTKALSASVAALLSGLSEDQKKAVLENV